MMAEKDNTPIGESEELSVTEVSKEVLDELSVLFGDSSRDDTDVVYDDPTPTPTDGDATATTNVVPLKPRDETVEDNTPDNVVVIASDIEDDISDLTPAPPDPLIGLSRQGDDVVEISDDVSTMVIDADELDRVVIIDNDTPDPTFEERRRRHERRERLRRVKWVKVAGLVVAAIVFISGVLASPLFAIRRVVFEGVVYTSPETVQKVTEAIKGASVFTVDTAKARAQMLDDPWVAEVRITTDFPGQALVEVAERKPVVWYVGDDEKARVVDDRGHVVAVLDGWPTRYLRVIGTGPSLDAGAVADDVYRAAAQLVLALPDEIRTKVKALELSGGGELAMILKSGTIVRFGPPTGLQNKLIAVVVLFRRQDPATLAVVDVSTGEPTVQLR
jgi:cell division septal protein FtsQ